MTFYVTHHSIKSCFLAAVAVRLKPTIVLSGALTHVKPSLRDPPGSEKNSPLATRKAAVFGWLYSRSMKRVPSALNGTVERAAQFVYGARSAMRQMGMGAKNGA